MDDSGTRTEAEAIDNSAAGADGRITAETDFQLLPMPSVLQQVQQKTQQKRRRGQPPGWTIWLAGQVTRSRGVVTHALPTWLMGRRQQILTVAISLAVHLAVAFVMALYVLPPDTTGRLFDLIVTRVDSETDVPMDVIDIEQILQPEAIQDLDTSSNMKQLVSDLEENLTNDLMIDTQDRDFTLELEPTDAEMEVLYKKGEFGGRSEAGKRAALKKYGGTADSEKSVVSGLRWLKTIQQKNGSWSFAKQGPGAVPGRYRKTEVGATSLALLCFLGAGHTHVKEGLYRETVEQGLAFIGESATVTQGRTADLRGDAEGNSGMYVQGLATICLSEAHALEHRDRDLARLTEMAVRFIERAQHPVTGGWRYKPRDDTSDTSVVGWEVMALQSAKSGRIRVSSKSLRLAREFLSTVQADDGAQYSYVPDQGAKPSMTAVGLLCRMYLGWRNDNPSLEKGVKYLAGRGPNRDDMYYNYYATQVLHHWGGDLWKKWNRELREQLVRSQITEGPAAGSWRPNGPHSDVGGQLYQTALSILTLEVYYRHLPIYQRLEQGAVDPAVAE
ncbi:MAG: terpene cyclase/mutase family protein [Fuerstiella sp.]|nr:terpene cyclase/mutase family protein [Fuerstiella sp.]MCP4785563.1 terpene cyclase/mutase family protein [Fuerstiella sp.]MCP4853626.1 terpene cyclase/mutase family protein [Fuerstiella sp.]